MGEKRSPGQSLDLSDPAAVLKDDPNGPTRDCVTPVEAIEPAAQLPP